MIDENNLWRLTDKGREAAEAFLHYLSLVEPELEIKMRQLQSHF